jgi:hypothetical protein
MGTAPAETRAPSIGALKLAQAQSLLEASGPTPGSSWFANRPSGRTILRFFFDLDFT